MNYRDVPAGRNVPAEINVLIEISKGAGTVKYEFDRRSGIIMVDRLRESAMHYPINYGCVPHSLSDDGDPLDVLVYCDEAIQTGTVIPVRPIGVLVMEDEKGPDVKIIAVPADRLTSAYRHIRDIKDLPAAELRKIEHFFKHYKDLDSASGRWSKTSGWEDVNAAHQYIRKAVDAAKKPPPPAPAP